MAWPATEERVRTGCPGCGADAPRRIADPEDMRHELEALWSFHLGRVRPDTPVRRWFDRAVFTQDPPAALDACARCGTVYRSRDEAIRLVGAYAQEDVAPAVLTALFAGQREFFRPRVKRLERLVGPKPRALEVGSYAGAFLSAATEAGWDVEGVDVNESTNRFARAQGMRVRTGRLEDIVIERRYDVVAVWNCFEQLPQPRRFLAAARRALLPGGVLVVRVPNGRFYTMTRRLLGATTYPGLALLALNNLLAFPYLTGYAPGALTRMLRRVGFRVVRLRGSVLVGMTDEFTRGWAALEQRLLQLAVRRLPRRLAPWLEIYARR